ncbi:hypothetical protein V3391_05315 [Luteimonas sp. SMYT11W]|uniref:META domain-containing protein n=1 Tax=Luteimonas flava TaxID=3115822 RepID=A0ABU7WCC7_9GAMM
MRIHPVHLLLPAALLLAACQPEIAPGSATAPATPAPEATAPAASSDDDVVVSTNEPFWQATVEGDTVVLRGVDAPERRFTGARVSMTADGRRIDASDADGSVVLIVRRMRCEDDMSGARFPMTGLLTIDGRGPFRGCARPASMPVPTPPGELGDDDASTTIPDRFLGRWDADADACRSGGSDMALRLEPGALRFHESIATPTSVLPLDNDAVRVTADYEGEGQTWTAERLLRLDGPDTLFVGDDAGEGVSRVRCEE